MQHRQKTASPSDESTVAAEGRWKGHRRKVANLPADATPRVAKKKMCPMRGQGARALSRSA